MKRGSWITLFLKTEEVEQSTDCQASAQFVLLLMKQNKKTVHGFDFLFLLIFLEQRSCDRIGFVSLTFQAFLVITY